MSKNIKEISIERFEEFFEEYIVKFTPRKIKCVIFGGLGNPKHSVVALYGQYLSQVSSYVEFVAVDILVEKADENSIMERRKEIYEEIGVNYTNLYAPNQYYKLLENNEVNIDAIFILTPVSTHFEILRHFEKAENLCFIVEKPTCSIEEGKSDFFEFVKKLESKGNTLYLIDTTMVSYSLDYFIKNDLEEDLGDIKRIQVIGLDNPWNPDDIIYDYGFLSKVEAINSRGLMKCNQNGGAGLGFDMGIHGVAALMKLLDVLELDTEKLELQKVILEALDIQSLDRDKGIESYMLARGELENIDIIIEGGKGADIWDRRIEIYGTEQTIIMGFGTLLHRNYLVKMKGSEVLEIITFNTKDTGYENHMKDIIQLILDRKEEYILSPQQSIQYMKNAMWLMNKIYNYVGEDIVHREDKIIKKQKGPHENIMINDEQQKIRKVLKEIQKEYLFI